MITTKESTATLSVSAASGACGDVYGGGHSAFECGGDGTGQGLVDVRLGDSHTGSAHGLAELGEVGAGEADGEGLYGAVDHLTLDLRVAAVVDDDEGDAQAQLRGRHELLDGEHGGPIAEDARDGTVDIGELRPERCGNAVAQGGETGHVEQLVRGARGQGVHGPVV